jgi:MOSC domain-containing protein YiiM
MITLSLESIYLSPGHNYVGRFGQCSGTNPIYAVGEAECVAGKGLLGDRFYGHKEDFKGQVTFFSCEVFEALCESLGIHERPASCLRRNFLVRGTDLNGLIGVHFRLQGIWFEGVEECRPCIWMDEAFGTGAEETLRGRGGLRARVLTSGRLRVESRLELLVVNGPPAPAR